MPAPPWRWNWGHCKCIYRWGREACEGMNRLDDGDELRLCSVSCGQSCRENGRIIVWRDRCARAWSTHRLRVAPCWMASRRSGDTGRALPQKIGVGWPRR
eukprot:scaffold11393_cov30-Tisochrysis_lutea.AAC.3